MDEDPHCIQRAHKEGFRAQVATPAEGERWLSGAGAVVVTYGDPERVLAWARVARQNLGVDRVLALSPTATLARRLQALGAVPVNPINAQATFLALMARNPDLVYLLTETRDQRDLCEVHIQNPALEGKRLRDLDLPAHVLVLSIHRGNEFLIPRGNTTLRLGDTLTLLGTVEDLDAVVRQLAHQS